MSANRLILVGALAVLLLAVALWIAGSRLPAQQAQVNEPLAPGLAARLNDVERVRIVGAGAKVLVTMERAADGWGLVERGGYPVDTAKLRALLLDIAEARRVEAKTRNPDLHERIGVEDIAIEDASGEQVEIEGGGEAVRIIVGAGAARERGSFVRHAGEAQSWQIDRALKVDREPVSWLQRDLVDILVERIEAVEVQPASGPRIAITRSQDSAGDFRLAELPAGREQASEFVADATAGLLSSLRFDDVFAADTVEVDNDSLRRSRFLLRDGLRIEIDSWPAQGKTVARFEAALDEAQLAARVDAETRAAHAAWQARIDTDAVASAAEDTADTELAPAPPLAVSAPDAFRAQQRQQVQAEVDALNQRFAQRVFILPAFKAGNLNRDLEAYLRPRP
jgi:hypothetical protein